MEGGIDHAGGDAVGDGGVQRRLAGAGGEFHQIAFADPALFGVVGMDLEPVLGVPDRVGGAPGLGADIVLRQDAPGREQERKARAGAFVGGHVFGDDEAPLAAHEAVDMHERRAFGRLLVAGPLDRALFVQQRIGDAGEGGGGGRDLLHHLGGVGIGPARAHGIGEKLRHLPVGEPRQGLHHLAHAVDAAFGIGEGAVLFEEGGAGQEDVGVVRGLVEEDVLHDDAVHRREAGRDMVGVGVGLQDVLALDVDAAEGAFDGGVEHVGDAQAGLGVDPGAPDPLEHLARGILADMAVAGKLVREGAHVAGALDVVLAAQRVHADAGAADIAGEHGEVGDAHHGGGALRMFGDAEAVVDRAVAAGGKEAGGGAQVGGGDAGQHLGRLGRMARVGDEGGIVLEFVPVAAVADEALGDQALGHDHMGHGGDDGDIGAGAQRQVMGGLDMGRLDEVDPAGVDHDEPCALAQALFQARGEDGVAVGRVGADDDDDVGLFDRIEVLRAGRGAVGLAEPVAGGRVADAGAGVGVVVAEDGADHLLHEVGFLVRAARGGDAADGPGAVLGLDRAQAAGGLGDGLVPADLAPGVGDAVADHGLEDAVAVGGIAPGEAALDAGMAAVGAAVFPRRHAHQRVALHLGLEGAADAAIGAGGDDGAVGGAVVDDGFFLQGRGRAGLHAGAAGDAVRGQRGVAAGAEGHAAVESAALDREREGALDLFAGAHAARADDAFRRVVGEIGVAFVLGDVAGIGGGAFAGGEVVLPGRVAHVAQADAAGHVLEFAVAVGRAGQAVERVVGDVEFHHPAAQFAQAVGLGADRHARGDRRGAGSGRAAAALDLDRAEAAGAEGLEIVAGAELGDGDPGLGGGAHHARPGGDGDGEAIDGERHQLGRAAGGGALVGLVEGGEDEVLHGLSPSAGRGHGRRGHWHGRGQARIRT